VDFTGLHGVTTQKIVLFIVTNLRTSYLTKDIAIFGPQRKRKRENNRRRG
jgi:hypothetical protein